MDNLLAIEQICARHAERYGLDTFPNQMEVITSEQMLDAYVSSGLPVNYGHWSFGKHFLIESGKYPMEKFVSHVLPLERVSEGIAAMSGRYTINDEPIRKVAIRANQ